MNIEKLPKWAQEYIKELSLERDAAVRALNEFCDEDTPAHFYTDDLVCMGENGKGPSLKKRYVQGWKMRATYAGVTLEILLRDNQIDISYDSEKRHMSEVALIPQSFNKVSLKTQEYMR